MVTITSRLPARTLLPLLDLVGWIGRHRRQAADRRALIALADDPRLLADVGLTRLDVLNALDRKG